MNNQNAPQKKWKTRHKEVLVILVILAIMLIMVIAIAGLLSNAKPAPNADSTEAMSDSSITLNAVGNDESIKYAKEDAQKIFDSLKNKFNASPDEFNKITWYTYKTIGKYYPNRSVLAPDKLDRFFKRI